jgi:hypothetical protein
MRMTVPLVPLFDRLPEIYRVRDAEQTPPDQLRAYLAAVETAFGAVYADIGRLYDDIFIDTCEDWVIPYIADLLGTTHLKGDPRTLRADVADTIALRRRKGTIGAIERLAVNLTGWACRCVELRENLGWSQHLNHQRPDAGGLPPYGSDAITRFTAPRGGTVPIRDPAALALLGTPFDNFSYTADVKCAADGAVHVNLPNLAIFLWRLAACRLSRTQPLAKGVTDLGVQPAGLVSEVDLEQRKIARTFPAGSWARGIALSPDESRLYVSNYYSGTLTGIDVKDGRIADTWPGRESDNLCRSVVLHPKRPKAYLSHLRSLVHVFNNRGSIFPELSICTLT